MFRRVPRLLSRSLHPVLVNPTDVFEQIQSGAPMNPSAMKGFIIRHFSEIALVRGLSEARIHAMDTRSLTELLRSLLYEAYVAVPFSVFTFDLEFTGLPGQTKGPASIIEFALYCPDTQKSFTSLVRPLEGSELSEEASKLTGIKYTELDAAPTFDVVLKQALDFVEENAETREALSRSLILSHGAKLADLKILNESARHYGIALPKHLRFADTYNVIKDLHRRRPVTKERLPPSWALQDLGLWLKLDTPPVKHRALPDAQFTWEVLLHSLDRYGDTSLTPRQQLVARFFASEGKARLESLDSAASEQAFGRGRGRGRGGRGGRVGGRGAVGAPAPHGGTAAVAAVGAAAGAGGARGSTTAADDAFDLLDDDDDVGYVPDFDDGTLRSDSTMARHIQSDKVRHPGALDDIDGETAAAVETEVDGGELDGDPADSPA
jgi:DNA polymerase III epsilon subunit-like protein